MPVMPWTYLFLAGACEMIWPLGFKFTKGFTTHHWATGLTFGIMAFSLWLMSVATKQGIPIGTAYAVWTGLGAAGTATLGILFFHEPRDFLRLGCLSLVVIGVVGLKFLAPPEAKPDETPATTTHVTEPTEKK